MVSSCERTIRPSNPSACVAETLESLRRRHLVHKMPIYMERSVNLFQGLKTRSSVPIYNRIVPSSRSSTMWPWKTLSYRVWGFLSGDGIFTELGNMIYGGLVLGGNGEIPVLSKG